MLQLFKINESNLFVEEIFMSCTSVSLRFPYNGIEDPVRGPMAVQLPIQSDSAARAYALIQEAREEVSNTVRLVNIALRANLAPQALSECIDKAQSVVNAANRFQAVELNQLDAEIIKHLQTEHATIDDPTFADALKLWDVTNSRPHERVAIMQYDIEGNPVIFKGRITNVYLNEEGQPMVEIFGGKGSNIAQKILCLKQSDKELVMEELVLHSHTRATFPLINIRQMIVTQSSESLPEVVGKKTILLGALPGGEVDESVLLGPVSNKADQEECFMKSPSPTFVGAFVHLRGSDEPKTRILQKIETPSAVLMRNAFELASQVFEATAMAYAHQ